MNRELCDQSMTIRKWLQSLTMATLVSLALSVVSAFVCLLFAGAGHASASPGLVFFGPVLAYGEFAHLDPPAATSYLNFAIMFIFVFYCFYGIAISVGRLVGCGRLALVVVLAFHYCGVGLCVMSRDWDGTRNIWMISQIYGGWITVFLVLLFVAIHLVAFQYAWSENPYRPRLNRRVGVVLCLGLAAGIVLHVVTSMQAPY